MQRLVVRHVDPFAPCDIRVVNAIRRHSPYTHSNRATVHIRRYWSIYHVCSPRCGSRKQLLFSIFRLNIYFVIPSVNIVVVGLVFACSVVAVIAHLNVEGVITSPKYLYFGHVRQLGVEGLVRIAQRHFAYQHLIVGWRVLEFQANHGHGSVFGQSKVRHLGRIGNPLASLTCIWNVHFLVFTGFAFQRNEKLSVRFGSFGHLIGDAQGIVGLYVEHGFEELNARRGRLSL